MNDLFSEFAPLSFEAWLAQLNKDLKGKDAEKLRWKADEGLNLFPYADAGSLADAAVLQAAHRRRDDLLGTENNWQGVAAVCVSDADAAEQIRQALAYDMKGIRLYGRDQADWPLWENALDVLEAKEVALHLDFRFEDERFYAQLCTYFKARNWESSVLTGTLVQSDKVGYADHHADFPYLKHNTIDLEAYAYSAAYQLAAACGMTNGEIGGVERGNTEASPAVVFADLAYRFPVGGDFYVEIAKLRAFRLMYARMVEAYGLAWQSAFTPFITAVTSTHNKTHYDANNNILRATTEAVSALLGGAHGLEIRPYKLADNTPFSRRVSYNIHHILKSESHLDKVVDAVGGSYYIEQLTQALASEAWKLFQQIEANGGFEAHKIAFDQSYQALVYKQQSEVSSRKKSIIGINQYPNPQERIQPDLNLNKLALAAAFEAFRNEQDQASQRPLVQLLPFGDLAMRNARAMFSRNLFAAGGFEVIEKEAVQPEADILVLCAADGDYQAEAATKIQAIRTQFPQKRIILAGKIENYPELGADGILYAGMGVLEFLRNQLP